MKKGIIFIGFTVFSFLAVCQNKVTKLLEYLPAPGQHINVEHIGTPQAALNMVANENDMVSLGAFGGTIILGFGQPCMNDPQNPYGVDFTIFGNAFEGASEPGIVSVMKDENNNGLADDTWYEIAGSNHYHPNTIKKYSLTYFNPFGLYDIPWKDSEGNNGVVKANSYHEQEYYPIVDTFPDYPKDSVTFKGTLLEPTFYTDNQGIIRLQKLAFGYADNHARKQGIALDIPDNPYTQDIVEGAGGDPVDISWAVDSEGNYVNLDQINFVKIITANLTDLGWLGEVSTDIKTIVDIEPNSATGSSGSLVIYHHKQKILTGDSLQFFAQFFEWGKPVNEKLTFFVSDETLASIDTTGMLKSIKGGPVEISVYAEGKEELIRKTSVTLLEPTDINITTDLSSLYPGDSIELVVSVLDQYGDKIDGLDYFFSNEANDAFRVDSINGKYYLIAENPGNGNLVVTLERNPEIKKSIQVNILELDNKADLAITIKDEFENIFPFQKITVPVFDLNSVVENRIGDYSGFQQPTLAHVIGKAFNLAGLTFKFRDDEKSEGKLYLYSVEQDGLFTYGWGGLTDPAAFAKVWIARVNGISYLNDFDKIPVHNGDTIILYHISDLLNPWDLTFLTASSDSASIGDLLEVELVKTSCRLQDQNILEQEKVPYTNQEVVVSKDESELFSGYTDSKGKYSFTVNNSPQLVVASGNNAVLIFNKFTTNNNDLEESKFRVYPNPFSDRLYFSGNNHTESELLITSLSGQIIFRQTFTQLPEYISLSGIAQGNYLFRITSKESSSIFKIVKR